MNMPMTPDERRLLCMMADILSDLIMRGSSVYVFDNRQTEIREQIRKLDPSYEKL